MTNEGYLKILVTNAKNAHRSHRSDKARFAGSDLMRGMHRHSKGMRDGFLVAARMIKGYATKAEIVNSRRRAA